MLVKKSKPLKGYKEEVENMLSTLKDQRDEVMPFDQIYHGMKVLYLNIDFTMN